MKKFITKQLANLARQLIKKHQPKIIGITGSVGKTSTRNAIHAVVSTAFLARRGAKNLNNEIGLPLAIIGADSPGRSWFGWLKVFALGYWQLWFGSFPAVLILEMGVDKPGDMDYLLSIARPDIAVITGIGVAHYEFFGSAEAVAQEKGKLALAVPSNGAVILNFDNPTAYQLRQEISAKVIGYGFNQHSDVRLEIIAERFMVPAQSELVAHTSTQELSVQLPAVGVPHMMSAGAAICVGLFLGLPIEKIQRGLSSYKPVAGRLNLLSGIKRTLIIDDTYNASPDSVKEALEILARFPHQHKVAVLGSMLELGELTKASHLEAGKYVVAAKVEKLITVGESGLLIAHGAREAGFPAERIVSFADSRQAANHVRDGLQEGSAILVKGSQGVRMERIVKELLANPMSAARVLTRQYGKWLES
ncbi:MAG TPA: UDP-N-acetylmuramoyl-tripeptide--D-alanyl-D-alanine ligase [Candidatus Doudnabacteria bacterium]|nr:UDP-N-acetylmuramoyl-tripeptide--D-alanyl-D-alanine ligase [Candidatus Doudnabacteria bacterium]